MRWIMEDIEIEKGNFGTGGEVVISSRAASLKKRGFGWVGDIQRISAVHWAFA
jgi:hypothetical protein